MVFDHLFDQAYNKNSFSSYCSYIKLIHSAEIKNIPNIYDENNHLQPMPGTANNEWSYASAPSTCRRGM
jgi:hypothetical protein